MVLQNIVWPEQDGQPEKELYYHGVPKYTEDGKLCIKAGDTLSFDTYFNSFSGKNWIQYTVVTQCTFCLILRGRGEVVLKEEDGSALKIISFRGNENIRISLSNIKEKMYYLEIRAKEDSILESGQVVTEQSHREIHLVLVTCTYNRQKELFGNLAVLKRKNRILQDGKPVLDWIYIVDNARNLIPEEIEDETTVLFPNPNTGGAGGFTRGLREAMKDSSMTHVLLMDDDVKIEFEAVARTKGLLAYLKDEYKDNFIGGAMLRKETPYMIYACGESWDNGKIINPHQDTDARTLEKVIEVMEVSPLPCQYNGWWYCCVPRSQMEEKGYPMPFFLHGDDIEYGLRNGKTPLYLNGIAVWHESFEDKMPSMLWYYDVRNWLIINAIYMKKGKRLNAIGIVIKNTLASILRYRYEDVKLSAMAVEDFLKGSDWLYRADPEQVHQKVQQLGYQMRELSDEDKQLEITLNYACGLKNRLRMMIGYILPARGRIKVRMGAPAGTYARKKEVWLVEPNSQKGFLVRKSWWKTVKCVGMIISNIFRLFGLYSLKIKYNGMKYIRGEN